MELTKEEQEFTDKYVLDIKNTLISNIVFLGFVGLVFVFLIQSIIFIGTLPENQKILGLIVFMFATLKMLVYIGQPNFEYKRRDDSKALNTIDT